MIEFTPTAPDAQYTKPSLCWGTTPDLVERVLQLATSTAGAGTHAGRRTHAPQRAHGMLGPVLKLLSGSRSKFTERFLSTDTSQEKHKLENNPAKPK
jgi:hypothetical protein